MNTHLILIKINKKKKQAENTEVAVADIMPYNSTSIMWKVTNRLITHNLIFTQ